MHFSAKSVNGYFGFKKPFVMSVWILISILILSFSQIAFADNSGNGENASNNANGRTYRGGLVSNNNSSIVIQQSNTANKTASNFTHPLQVKLISTRPIIFLDLQVTDAYTFNYTLQCDHPSTMYVVLAKSMSEDVATIIAGNPVKISCTFGTILENMGGKTFQQNTSRSDKTDTGSDKSIQRRAVGENSGTVNILQNNKTAQESFEISGQFELLFKSHRIGRSFFLMFANKIMGPGTQAFPYGPQNTNKTAKSNIAVVQKPPVNPLENKQPTSDNMKRPASKMGPPGGGAGGGLPPNTVMKSMILVMKLPSAMDDIFRTLLYVVIITATIGMGIKVEWEVVKEVMKKPLGPCIGLFCQYVCMPLIAYVVAQTVPQPSAAISLGIFTCGIVPGGGASNFWCYLLGGDVTLSVTMTTISSFAALGFIPMWLFTLGENFKDDKADIHVPYTKILETLAIVLLPVFAGMMLKRWLPKVAKVISKILKPFLIITVLFLLGVGIYANFYIFAMIKPMQILAGCLLPYIGYLIGGGIALLTCRTWIHVKTIAIETGIQNTGIAFMIVFFSLTPPDNQLAVVAPAASAIMTPLPLLVVTIFYTIYIRHKRKQEKKDDFSLDTKDDTAIQVKDPSSQYRSENNNLSIWDKIRGKRPDELTPEEEMLNHEIIVSKGSSKSRI